MTAPYPDGGIPPELTTTTTTTLGGLSPFDAVTGADVTVYILLALFCLLIGACILYFTANKKIKF